MRSAKLTRKPSTDEGTFGYIELDDGTQFYTGELPWKDNQEGISCIPEGEYLCKWIYSAHHAKWLYQVTDVPNRTMIEIHSANFSGDKSKGFKCDLLGCIALGKSTGLLADQEAVLQSVDAIKEFESNMNGEDFTLTIVEAQ